ncbi:MAG TPA: hypothetical protein VID27_17940, partial [Blastocatellia bacterium]
SKKVAGGSGENPKVSPARLERAWLNRNFLRVKLPRSGAERAAALGSEAKRNGDGRAQYYFSRSQRVPFRISLFHRLADCGIRETT